MCDQITDESDVIPRMRYISFAQQIGFVLTHRSQNTESTITGRTSMQS
jgi:hypothetical protein